MFALDWLDEDIINSLNNSNIKTIVVFNRPSNELIKIVEKNMSDLILQKENTFEYYDIKNSDDDEWKNNKEVKFVKI